MGSSFNLLLLCLGACHFVYCASQTVCSGTLRGTLDAVVVEGGASCTLRRATVSGSVSVTGGGMLTTTGRTQIFGSIEADNAGDILVSGRTTVSGSVLFSNSPSSTITIGRRAVVTSVSLENSGNVVIIGTAGGLESKASGMVNFNGGVITGGGLLVEQGTGDVVLCGADISGGISFTERTGDLIVVSSASCAPSTLVGSVGIEKGEGDVLVTGANFTSGDLGVVEQTGTIRIETASLSDIGVEKSSGPIILASITTDSDVGLKENQGSVQISDSSFLGDVGVEQNGAVEVTGSTFGFESASFKLNTGPVEFIGNRDVSVSFEENSGVEIRGNNITEASVTSNTGGVSIVDNVFQLLSCVDNRPRPTGSGNTIVLLAEGQCRGF